MDNEIEEEYEDNKIVAINNEQHDLETIKENEKIKQEIKKLSLIINQLDLGYSCEFDNPDNPTALIIKGNDGEIITSFSSQGFQLNLTLEGNSLVEKLIELSKENEDIKQLVGETINEIEDPKLIDGDQKDIEPVEEEKPETEIEKENKPAEEVIQEELGPKYKILSAISYTGNENEVDKIHSLGGIVGKIYKIKDEETGMIYPGGIGCDGEVKIVDDFPRERGGGRICNILQDDNTIKQKSLNSDLIYVDNSTRDTAIVMQDECTYKVSGLTKGNPIMIKMNEKDPSDFKQTTREQDETKKNPKDMNEITEILDRSIEKGYISEQKKLTIMEEIMNNGRDIEEDKKQLERFEKEKDKEKEKEKENNDGWGPWESLKPKRDRV